MKPDPSADELARRVESLERKIDVASLNPLVRHYIALRLLHAEYTDRLDVMDDEELDDE